MKKVLKKSALFIGLSLMVLITINTVYSYYYGQLNFDNPFAVVVPRINIIEKFNANDYWVPGEEKEKVISFENDGEMDLLLRFQIVEPTWSMEGGEVQLGALTINYAHDLLDNWQKIDDWYYYKKVFSKESQTSPVVKSVTFSNTLSNTVYQEGDVDFSSQYVDIDVRLEAIQVQNPSAEENWEVSFTILGEAVEWETAGGQTTR